MKKLSREAWIEAGFLALDKHGYQQLSIEKTARRMNVTRGSFYHHFSGRSEYVEALLDRWKAEYTDSVITYALAGSTTKDRLERYLDVASRLQPGREVAIRAWAAREPLVRAVLGQVDANRMKFACQLGRELLVQDQERQVQRFARIACLAFIGFQQTGPHGSNNFIELVQDVLSMAGTQPADAARSPRTRRRAIPTNP